jgi:hypothetical protein
VTTLVDSTDQTVGFLRQKLSPVASVPEDRILPWIRALDSPKFEERERAAKELQAFGDPAKSPLKKALAQRPGPEVQRRLERILEALTPTEERLHKLRAIEVLERIATPEATDVLRRLSGGDRQATLTREAKAALERASRTTSR